MNTAYIISTESRTVTTKNLTKWIKRNYGSKAFFSSFDAFEGVFVGSILLSSGQNVATPVERVYEVTDKATGVSLSLSEVQQILENEAYDLYASNF